MYRIAFALVLVLGSLVGCTARTPLPAPTPGEVFEDAPPLVVSLSERAQAQSSVRFTTETTMSGRTVRLEGGLLRAREGRLVALREDSVIDVVSLADKGFARTSGAAWTRHATDDRVPGRTGMAFADVADTVDPVAVVESLGGSLLVASEADTVNGVATHRYTVLVDLRQQAGNVTDPEARARLNAAYASGFTASATVWVGPGDLPVKVEQVLKTLEDKDFRRTVHTFTDWNADIRVVAPV
ncbi:hypothetical protein GCM10022243_45980 [Saccharothrix violaceirubra]|uniref:Lipoprotein LprG n=1 Tax=Saccharothrix violaceirubra TaxID=413306 RepID=A0A7W7T1U6_9PSEU|nr:hypothetical protein [Saccharothrix violaceirubra]MBB4964512.1 hypothetical protein [Saccharothrix violaceirubra]